MKDAEHGGLKAAKRARARGPRRTPGLKRAYERPSPSDGMCVLVDRLWPRGLSKKQLAIGLWLKDVATSDALRRWYGHDPRRWESFAVKYRAELARRTDLLRTLDELQHRRRITLVYGARDETRNNAVVLREVLRERRFAGPRTRQK